MDVGGGGGKRREEEGLDRTVKYVWLDLTTIECCLHGISLTSPDKKGAITGWWNRSVRREVRRKVGKGRVGEGRREGSALSMTALKALDTV